MCDPIFMKSYYLFNFSLVFFLVCKNILFEEQKIIRFLEKMHKDFLFKLEKRASNQAINHD